MTHESGFFSKVFVLRKVNKILKTAVVACEKIVKRKRA